jgi:protocatechuate 3,4-dioxygenase alpha subunit
VFVFARGLLRHQLTRIYLDGGAGAEDETLLAAPEGGGFRFDIRMQGDRATLFFEH